MITIIAEPENKREILLALDLRLQERGQTRAEFAMKNGFYVHILANLLNNRTAFNPVKHAHIARPVNKLTGATMASWEN